MAIVDPNAAVAQGAAAAQAVQITVQAAQAAAVAAPVVLPATGAEPVQAAVVAPAATAVVVEPAVSAQAAVPQQALAEPVVELTPSQKIEAKITAKKAQIAKLSEEVARLEAQFRSADLLASIKSGSVIVARVGRAETARDVVASVVGVQTLDNGDRRLKIYFGEGFDAETVVIQDSQIVDVKQV